MKNHISYMVLVATLLLVLSGCGITTVHCHGMGITTSGKLSLSLPESGGRVSLATVSGELNTALPYKTAGDLRVFGDGGCEINVVTTSGDLKLK